EILARIIGLGAGVRSANGAENFLTRRRARLKALVEKSALGPRNGPVQMSQETPPALLAWGREITPSRISLTRAYLPIGITWIPRQSAAIDAASSRAIARPSAFSQSGPFSCASRMRR